MSYPQAYQMSPANHNAKIKSFDIEKGVSNGIAMPKPESEGNLATAIDPKSLRRAFIRKVLVILTIQLIISTITIGLTFIDSIGVRKFMREHQYILWIALAVSIVVIIVLACCRSAFRRVPYNYLLLLLYTCSISYVLGAAAAVTKSTIVIFSGGFTLFAVVCIGVFAWTTKKDLTKKWAFLTTLSAMLLMLLIFGLIFQSKFVNVVISTVIGLIFGFLFAVDLQRLSGKYEQQYSLDEYIIAALDLYIDIVQIFLAILGVSRNLN